LTIALAGGCGSENDPIPPPATIRERLTAAPETFSLVADPPGVAMHTAVTPSGGTTTEYDYELDVTGGVTVRADAAGNLVLDDLAFDVEDLEITMMALPPDGLVITEIHAEPPDSLSAPGTWAMDGVSVDATTSGPLLVDWAFIDDSGAPVPLGQFRIEDVEFVVSAVLRADEAIEIDISASRTGDFAMFTTLVTLSNIAITTRGTAGP
jgi:hypothetical protein